MIPDVGRWDRERGVRVGFTEEVAFVQSFEGSWHWDRQRWRREKQARVAELQKRVPFLHLSQILLPTDPSTIEASNFQMDKKTHFIIHGFIDKGDDNWLLEMCQVGPAAVTVACSVDHCHSWSLSL